MTRLIWLPIAAILSGILAAIFWLVCQDGRRGPSAYIFATADAAQEAGSCHGRTGAGAFAAAGGGF